MGSNVFTSWRTTLIGIIILLAAISPELIAALDTDPETIPQWNNIIQGILALFGFGVARDNHVNDERAGVPHTTTK